MYLKIIQKIIKKYTGFIRGLTDLWLKYIMYLKIIEKNNALILKIIIMVKFEKKKLLFFDRSNIYSNNKEISINNHNNKCSKYYEHIFKFKIMNQNYIHQLKNGNINIHMNKIWKQLY